MAIVFFLSKKKKKALTFLRTFYLNLSVTTYVSLKSILWLLTQACYTSQTAARKNRLQFFKEETYA